MCVVALLQEATKQKMPKIKGKGTGAGRDVKEKKNYFEEVKKEKKTLPLHQHKTYDTIQVQEEMERAGRIDTAESTMQDDIFFSR